MTLAKNLRIGEPLELAPPRKDEDETIKALHELCIQRPRPHVHVVTTRTSACYGFNQPVFRG